MAVTMKVCQKRGGTKEFSYVDEDGYFISPFIFKIAEPFNELTCSAKVQLRNGEWNFLNPEGKFLSPASFSEILEDDGIHYVVVNEDGLKNIFCPAEGSCLYDDWQEEVSLENLK